MLEGKKTSKTKISPPKITLPKGGGAIRGIGEKFTANAVTGNIVILLRYCELDTFVMALQEKLNSGVL